MSYRTDWAEAVGITEAPDTIEEVYDMLYKFTYNDPDGNGQNDTYGMEMTKYTGPFDIIQTWFGCGKNWQEVDGELVPVHMTAEYKEAIDWINENIEGTPVMLEANGDSYTYANRVSVLTGLPTVMGWFTHEWLWKDSYDLANERAEIVKQMYTSEDAAVIRELMEEYNVSYVYVGDQERTKFDETGINEEAIKALVEIVFQNEGVYIVKIAQ